ncbi:MAG TPA: DUF389 domain-containing protein [Saprospiraceae bacterium]|nr:DUF389 domain-containing protein [Saprospiraceae bacterium]
MKLSNILQDFGTYFKGIFNIYDDTDWKGATDDIKAGIQYRGANLWTLIFAILIASVGLNVNSTAVVIGAMLISPLMGPILGIGLALGTNDIGLFKDAGRNLLIALVISVLTSALYFWLTPLHEAQSELLARTRPTIFDVLIATFGGLIGIIVSTREGYSNAIPGVAIATALMPPLCTAGYGLASANWEYFFGALYLFFINGIFIALATMVVVRYLKFPMRSYIDAKTERRARNAIIFLALITIIPSVFVAINVVKEVVFTQKAESFVNTHFNFDNRAVIKYETIFDKKEPIIEVTLLGERMSDEEILDMQGRLAKFGLAGAKLKIKQFNEDLNDELADMNKNLRTEILEDLYKRNDELMTTKDEEIKQLKNQLYAYTKAHNRPIAKIYKELQVEYPEIVEFGFDEVVKAAGDGLDTVPVSIIHTKKKIGKHRMAKLTSYLKLRLDLDTIQLVVY